MAGWAEGLAAHAWSPRPAQTLGLAGTSSRLPRGLALNGKPALEPQASRDTGGIGKERDAQARSRQYLECPVRITEETKANCRCVYQPQGSETACGVGPTQPGRVQEPVLAVQQVDRKRLFEGCVISHEEQQQIAAGNRCFENRSRNRPADRHTIDEQLAGWRLVVRPLAAADRYLVGRPHAHHHMSVPKAASAPKTNAPTTTHTGAPGPHARPASAPPAIEPPMPAPVTTSSRPAAAILSSATAT